ncbi:sensor histidine kinase [Clostridium oryzae]|uniref:histidine kinase n=1 Tax=Clostridium oryzae TaxID=1450648 RepID=A0A1V4II34_9CLOT|nr:HAMP domain-containing sensor histidine kinase [Clostridium oryzae]OPJ59510.1 alkaline phosphatase synthesis sensor protein PhoR [Clostridium oryzae]
MAIRLKNDLLKVIIKLAAIILFGLFTFSVVNVVIFYRYILVDSYYKSDEFVDKVAELTNDLERYYGKYTTVNNRNQKSQNEWLESFDRKLKKDMNKVNAKYNIKIASAEKNKDDDLVKSLKEEKEKEISKIKKEYSKNVDQLKKSFRFNSLEEYRQINDKMKEWKILKYYLIDRTSGEAYTNITKDADSVDIDKYIKQNSNYALKLPVKFNDNNYREYYQYKNISKIFEEDNWKGYFIVPKQTDGYNTYNAEYIRYSFSRQRILKQVILGSIFFVVSIVLAIVFSANREEQDSASGNLEKLYMLIPLEIRMFFILVFSLMYLYTTEKYQYMMQYEYLTPAYLIYMVITIIYSFFMLINLKEFYFMFRDISILKLQCRRSVIGMTIQLIKDMVYYKDAAVKTVIRFLSMFFVLVSGFVIYYQVTGIIGILAVFYLLIYFILMPIFTFRRNEYLNKIVKATRNMVQGNMSCKIDEHNSDILLKELAHNINNIGEGYKKSLNEQMKSERMKSELITNVSHDLKTPLTSIINYVDLLKSGRLSDEEKEGYISVIARKSERLKVLIEDLFEAAKMTSGAVKLNIEKIDVTALLKQALAEFDEKIEKSSLIFRTNIPAGNIYLNLDGKKTWRVFENMINNILKYSQPGTRVYIELIELDESVKIIMKNIANYEMDFDVEEISERFKRGDKSRHTEGTGLGLAIAKSILDMENGQLRLSIDGDLFKAVVEFKKSKEKEKEFV